MLYRSTSYPKSAAVLIFIGAVVYALGPLISMYASVVRIFQFADRLFAAGVAPDAHIPP